jgi:hypothetical protein
MNSSSCSGAPFNFQTQRDSFANPLRHLIEGPRLGMAGRNFWNGSDVIAFRIALNDDIKLA